MAGTPALVCMKMATAAAAAQCQANMPLPNPSPTASPNWDALAVSLTSQSNAISWGAVILGVIVALAGLAWGKIITINAEKEARETAEAEVRKWLQDEGSPMMLREASEFLRTFREQPISDDELADLVRAAGADRKEGDDGKN